MMSYTPTPFYFLTVGLPQYLVVLVLHSGCVAYTPTVLGKLLWNSNKLLITDYSL